MDFSFLLENNSNENYLESDNFIVNSLFIVLNLIFKYINLYSELFCFFDIFYNIQQKINKISKEEFPIKIQELILLIINFIKETENKIKKYKRPLELQTKKPIPIKTLNPKFDDKFSKNKIINNSNIDETNKLKKLHKKETKGAIRELRKDNSFLSFQKHIKRKSESQEIKEKGNKIMAMLQSERNEEKQLEKEKQKLIRKRSAFK
jgi:nucleolar protein 14